MIRPKVCPFLWFHDRAEEAARFYVSLFPNSEIVSATPGPDGKAKVVEFRLAGIPFMALNGGPYYTLNGAFSLSVDCQTQDEVDHFWEKLTEGGSVIQCGWLTDRFGLTWQVVPTVLPQLLLSPDPAISGRVMEVMLKMDKLIIRDLEEAAGIHK
ncbi:MAG: VOC family protein [Gemmataceae bacterium]